MIVCMICGMILWMSLWALKEEHCTDNHLLRKQAAIAATTAASKWGSVKSWLGPCFQSKSPYPLTPANGFCNATAPRKEAMLAKTAWPMPINYNTLGACVGQATELAVNAQAEEMFERGNARIHN